MIPESLKHALGCHASSLRTLREAPMEGGTKQTLRFAENLTLPKVQVVVVRANVGCSHCRSRVSQVVAKMNGLLDYMVDLGKKEVVVRGVVDVKRRKSVRKQSQMGRKKKASASLDFFGLFLCSSGM